MLTKRIQLRSEGAALTRAAAREQHVGRHATAPPEVELCRRVVHARDPREELREIAADDLEERPTMHRVKGVLHVDGGVDPVRMKLQMSVDRMHKRVEARAASHAELTRERPCCGGSGGSAGGREGVRRKEVGGEATTEGEGSDHRDNAAEDRTNGDGPQLTP